MIEGTIVQKSKDMIRYFDKERFVVCGLGCVFLFFSGFMCGVVCGGGGLFGGSPYFSSFDPQPFGTI